MNKIFRNNGIKAIALGIGVSIFLLACDPEPIDVVAEYDSTQYKFEYPVNFSPPNISVDNPLTIEGVKLGKMLFYEKKLSKDNTQACAGCHLQKTGFSDENRFSKGVEGKFGARQAMPIFNMAWHENDFFWDGRAATLREQALMPIQDPLEMNETLENVVAKLRASNAYKNQFIRAFNSSEITSKKVGLALEQFMLSIVSFDSKYDRYLDGKATLSESEERGRVLFFKEYNPFYPEDSGADCAHCHGGPNFEHNDYFNNGLDTDANFKDIGREKVTNQAYDRAAFKMPSLRNVEYTAPYMHDGRFKKLEEVIEHYNSGVKMSSSVSPLIIPTIAKGLMLKPQDKIDLVNFLKTLSDPTYINNKAYAE